MIKKILFLSFFLCAFFSKISAQIIEAGTVDAGPYGKGSTIAAPVLIDDKEGKILVNSTFKLYLSDASGSFAAEQLIGSYNGFYTTFVNGIIPANLPAGNYKVRIKTTSPEIVSAGSNTFAVANANGIQASADAPAQTISTNPKTFGSCISGRANAKFSFINTSSPNAAVTAVFTNGFNASDVKKITFQGSTAQQVSADVAHYTIFVKAELNGVIATQSYFLINNTQNTPFSTFGSNTVCLPKGVLEYGVETNSPGGIQSNFPGYTYRVNWGDQSIENYTLNQIKANNGKVRHTYYKSSCGSQVVIGSVQYYNVFGIGMQLVSPFCNEIGTPVSTQAKVVTQPENRFGLPEVACLNTALTIPNNSIAGENPSSVAPECNNNNVVYFWYVDNVLVTPNGVPIDYQLKHTFTAAGKHVIRLESESSSDCQAGAIEREIQIQMPPKPSFKLSTDEACISSVVKTTNTSVTDNTGGAQNAYQWVISGPAAPVFVNGTTSTSQDAELSFTAAGVYTVKLLITSSCSPVTAAEQTVIVNDIPKITANWQANICGKGQLLTFSNTQGNPVTTSFYGTFKDEVSSYDWVITGGKYSFKEGSSQHSKEPVIFFEDYGTYTVKITSKNNCGSVTVTKALTFNESPAVAAGSDLTICAGNSAQLNGSITGPPPASYSWTGGTGTFIPGRNVLKPQYLPSAAEITAGEVQLSLTAATNIPAPCNQVTDIVIITINPPNRITSAASKEICTGTELNYTPEALITASIINWTATGTPNASGFSASGTGDIKAILTNTSISANAVITYIITPEANGCPGEPFTFKVTVSPTPGVQIQTANKTICTGQKTEITLVPAIANTLYTWTSTVSGSVSGNSEQSTPASITSIADLLVNAGNTPGSVTYIITPLTAAGCTGSSVSVTINVTAAPIEANAGEDQKLCSEGTVKLNANHPGSGTGKWTLSSSQTGITFDNSTKKNAIASGLKPGQVYRFKWTITGPGTCNSSTDEVVINNLAELANNTISYAGFTVCEGSSITVTGSTATGGDTDKTYSWETSTDGSAWNPVNLNSNKSLTIVLSETMFFRRTVTSGDCSNTSSIVKAEVQKGISGNTISSSQHVCLNTVPAKLTGSMPSGADGSYTYQWQQSTDDANWAVIAGAVNPDYQPGALTQTVYFRRAVTSSLCKGDQQSASASVLIKVSKGALANFNWLSDAACAPFTITAENIKAETSDAGDTYRWFANNILIGTGISFPGFTLQNAGDHAEITLEVTSALGCGKTVFSHEFKTNASLTAAFTASSTGGCGPVTVSFSNKTINTAGINFEWKFGNGQVSYQLAPPAITYQPRTDGKDTTYAVILKAQSVCAISFDTAEVKVVSSPAPRFAPSTVEGCSPLTVTFKNSSPSASSTYVWNFGDGTIETFSDNRSVKHIYTTGKSKIFTVTVTQKNACGEKSLSHGIKVAPNTISPDLLVQPEQLSGCAPHTVKFYNYTTGAKSYAYVFGDGTDTIRTNSDEPIEHTFTKGGDYFVKLISSSCSDTTVIKKITVFHQADAKFTANITEGCAPLAVKFSNKTTNAIYQFWDFGNGKTYTGANPPAQTYTAKKSSYTVKLITKSNFGCMDTLVMEDYIKVQAPPEASFEITPGDEIQYPNYRFVFKNTTTGTAAKLTWDFGDKSSFSSEPNPEHSYPDTGAYKVRLTVSNAIGCSDTYEHTVRITGTPGSLYIPNAFMPNSASQELRAFRAKGSGIEKWNFRIFNKWGELVWHTDKLDEKGAPVEFWDGTLNGIAVAQGVYFWEVSAKFKNGNEWPGMSYNDQEPKKSGVIHLIR